jgi:virginiamycin A acetyltransferase
MSGIAIGSGSVIGARAVVTKDVLPYGVYGGIPARFLRWRFSYPIINSLRKIRWWDWPKEKIMDNAHLLLSENINAFIKAHEVI